MWNALQTNQRAFAHITADACRYATDVAPFAALRISEPETLAQLHALVAPGETIILSGPLPAELHGFRFEGTIPCVQLVLPENAPLPGIAPHAITPLTTADVPAMLALTTLTNPGPFRTRTLELGTYLGIHHHNELIAMAGERMAAADYREISAVCTHPAHTGKGYAAALIAQLMHNHRRDNLRSCLHAAATNHRAIQLYQRLGFVITRDTPLHRLVRTD